MCASDSSIERLNDIFLSELDEHFTDDELQRKARMLLNLYKAVYGSVKEQIRDVNTQI